MTSNRSGMRMSSRIAVLAAALCMALVPGAIPAATPPLLVATSAGFASPVLTVRPGETVSFRSGDVAHNFSTAIGLCDSASNTVPAACDVDAPGLLVSSPIRFHEAAPPGQFDFYCKYHAFWMRGLIVVTDPS